MTAAVGGRPEPPLRALEGRRIVVTGGLSGIGAATVDLAAERGAEVWIVDRRAPGEAGWPAGAAGGTVADVAVAEQVGGAMAEAVGALGGLDGLVVSAGVGSLDRLETVSDALFDRIVGVNLGGAFKTLRAAAPHLLASPGSSIVTLSSVSGHRPTFGEAAYSAAKAGVSALSRAAALEWAPSVRVNCVSPGFISTPLTRPLAEDPRWSSRIDAATPAGRVGTAGEVAAVVCFLLSDEASYLTGADLVVDGGSMLPSAQMEPILRGFLGERD